MESFTTLWPVRWQRPVESQEASIAMQVAATVLAEFAPTAQLSVVLQSGRSEDLRAWVGFTSSQEDDTETAEVFTSTLQSLVPWLGLDFEEPTTSLPSVTASAGMAFKIETRETERRVATPKQSALIGVTGASKCRWQLTMSSGMKLAEKSGDQLDFAISLIGGGPEISVASSLLEIDTVSDERAPTVVAHRQSGDRLTDLSAMAARGQAPLAGLTDSAMVGRLLSLPLRSDGPWPHVASKPVDPENVLEVFDASIPPHVLVVGGSGQGKTTTLLNATVRSARSGHTPIIVDPHGDLARRTAALFEEEGIAHTVLDFGVPDPLAWNLTQPPPGIDPETWITILTTTIRDLWPDLGSEYTGPVWTRVTRALISILVLDPHGPHPLTMFPELMSADSPFRGEAVARIGVKELARTVKQEIEPMLNQRDPGNTVTWITSKLDPIIGDPSVRSIIGRDHSEVDIGQALDGMPLIVSVPTTHLTDDGARLLAGIVVGQLWLCIQKRRPEREIDLFVDEWHRIPTPALPPLLAEGRKFGVNLRLSNQNASQIRRSLWDTALANTGGIIAFRTGPSDARFLDALYPTIPASSITRLPKHWVAVTTGDRDFTAPSPSPIGEDDLGAALGRGHRRAVAHAETSSTTTEESEQLEIDLLRAEQTEPLVESDEHDDPTETAEWLASLGATISGRRSDITD